MKKILIILSVLSLVLLSGCGKDFLVEGEVQRVGKDFIVINNHVYDLCYGDEEIIKKGDIIAILTSGTGTGGGCNSKLLEIETKECNC